MKVSVRASTVYVCDTRFSQCVGKAEASEIWHHFKWY